MGSRKNYKASVEVGSEVFHCFVLLCLPLSFHPQCGLSSCAIFGHSYTCEVVGKGVFLLSFSQQTMLLKKSSYNTSGPMAHNVSHKRGSRIIVHGSTMFGE